MSKKNLLIITNAYPEKLKENFLAEEVPILSEAFKKINILPLSEVSDSVELPINVSYSNILAHKVEKKTKLKYFLRRMLYIISLCIKHQRLNKPGVIHLCRMGVLSERLKVYCKDQELTNRNTLCYSYWLDEGVTIFSLFNHKNQWDVVSRAHGYDLYEEDYPQGLPPFYYFGVKTLKKIFFISKNGLNYFKQKNKSFSTRLEMSTLGTIDHGLGPNPLSKGKYKIVSCSSIIELKRLALLAEALNYIEVKVEWHHFGDGPLKEEVLSLVDKHSNCSVVFHGHVSNSALLQNYKTNGYDLFVNVSRTEGLPVSLIEAASFGIPLLATNVRGTSEICNDATGILVPKDISSEELSKQITIALKKKWNRVAIRKFWEDHFYYQTNYQKFAEQLLDL